jgi:hypothetical protein
MTIARRSTARLFVLLAVLAAGAVLAGARPAAATTYLPITDADLIQRSAVVVRGTVGEARVEEGTAGFVTVYRFLVAETWKGGSAPEIKIVVPGGSDGRRTTYFWGMPEFQPGDEEVLFLNAGRDGRFRISELLLGAFEVVEDAVPLDRGWLSGELRLVLRGVAVPRRQAQVDRRCRVLYPAGTGVPNASSISFHAGRTRANNAQVLLSSDGTGRATVKNNAAGALDLVIDVNGYYE